MNNESTLINFLSNLSKTTLRAARKDLSEERERINQQAQDVDDEEDLQEYDDLRAELEHFVDLIDEAMKTAFYD